MDELSTSAIVSRIAFLASTIPLFYFGRILAHSYAVHLRTIGAFVIVSSVQVFLWIVGFKSELLGNVEAPRKSEVLRYLEDLRPDRMTR